MSTFEDLQRDAQGIQQEFERAVKAAWEDRYLPPAEKRRKVDEAEAKRQEQVVALQEKATAAQAAQLDQAARRIEAHAAAESKRLREVLGNNTVYANLLQRELEGLSSDAIVQRAQSAPAGFDREFLSHAGRLIVAQRAEASPSEAAHHTALAALTPPDAPEVVEAKALWREAEHWNLAELDQTTYAEQLSAAVGVSTQGLGVITADQAHSALDAAEQGMPVAQPPVAQEA